MTIKIKQKEGIVQLPEKINKLVTKYREKGVITKPISK